MVVAHMTTIQDIAAGAPFAGPLFGDWLPERPEEVETLYRSLDLGSGDAIPQGAAGAVPGGWLVVTAGLGGFRIGHVALTADGHGLTVDGPATASDVMTLIAAVKTKVRNTTDGLVELRERVSYGDLAS